METATAPHREVINPADEKAWHALRAKDITSTEVSALFGISPYCTAFELWHRKRGNVADDFEMNDRVLWGKRLEDSIALGVAQDKDWKVSRIREYMRIPELRMGASFDFSIDATPIPEAPQLWNTTPGLLEIKNVDSLIYKQGWAVDEDTGHVEAPGHIEIQVQHQLAVSGRAFAYIAAFVGGNRVELIKREPDETIINAIKIRVAAFWASIDAGAEPQPNFETDSSTIAKLYGFAEPGKILDARGDVKITSLAQEYKAQAEIRDAAEAKRDAIKAELLTLIGDAERVEGDGFTSITAGIVGECPVSYVRKAYRNFRINWPRKKAGAV